MSSLEKLQNIQPNPEGVYPVTVGNGELILLPDELILEIFANLQRTFLPPQRGVCSTFKRLAFDRFLIKDEIKAIQTILEQIPGTQEKKDANRREIAELMQQSTSFDLKLFQLVAMGKQQLVGLDKKSLAALACRKKMMENAPLFQRYFRKHYLECWRTHLKKAIEARPSPPWFRLDLNFKSWCFSVFLEALDTFNPRVSIELDFSVSPEQAFRIASAFREGILKPAEVTIYGDEPQVKRDILEQYLQGISSSAYVKKLKFAYCSLYGDMFQLLERSLRHNHSLVSLAFNDFSFTPENIQTLTHMLEEHRRIKTLSVSGCSSQEVVAIFENVNQTHIEKLDLSECEFKPQTVAFLAQRLPHIQKLQEINLQHNRMTNDEIEILEAASLSVPGTQVLLPAKKIDFSFYKKGWINY